MRGTRTHPIGAEWGGQGGGFAIIYCSAALNDSSPPPLLMALPAPAPGGKVERLMVNFELGVSPKSWVLTGSWPDAFWVQLQTVSPNTAESLSPNGNTELDWDACRCPIGEGVGNVKNSWQ